jgi:hypothetical protein
MPAPPTHAQQWLPIVLHANSAAVVAVMPVPQLPTSSQPTFAPLVWVHVDDHFSAGAELAHAPAHTVAWQQEALQE